MCKGINLKIGSRGYVARAIDQDCRRIYIYIYMFVYTRTLIERRQKQEVGLAMDVLSGCLYLRICIKVSTLAAVTICACL